MVHGAGIAAYTDAFKNGAALSRHKFCSLFVHLLLVLILYPCVNEGSFRDFVFRVIGFGIPTCRLLLYGSTSFTTASQPWPALERSGLPPSPPKRARLR